MATFYKLIIKEIIKETSDAVSILFNIPNNLKETFSFKSGQYITLKTIINKEEVRRAYSICSSPNSNELKVAVKAVENGKFSIYATTKLQEGDEIEVAPPEGKFILEPSANKNYIGFAAGSGITPVLSMIKSVLEEQISSTFTLIYGNKSTKDTIFKNELDDLSAAYPTQFKLHYIFSREQQNDTLFGRVDQGSTNYYIKNKYKNVVFSDAFLCGPEKMVNIVSQTLQEHNISKENIHFELFTASVSEEDLSSNIPEGKTEITVLLDDEETTFTMSQKDDVLAASLRNKLDAPYSCQGGVCSSCLAKVTEGNAVMIKNTILTDDEVEEGFILTCQAHPTTSKITIDFDDV